MIQTLTQSDVQRFGNCWININRECNLRCTWCYAKSAGYSSAKHVDIQEYKRVLPILSDIGIQHITLLGGEPTISSDLSNIIRLAADYDITSTLVSNGVALANNDLLTILIDSGLGNIDISLKGSDEREYLTNTRLPEFDSVMSAISNVARSGIRFSVSTVLSQDSIHTILCGLAASRAAGARFFSLSFCYDFSGLSTQLKHNGGHPTVSEDVQLIKDFQNIYPKLCEVTENHFSLMQSYPLCLWTPTIIRTMLEKGQINSVCQLLDQSGLVFDTDFTIIPCNAMSNIKLGTFGTDWSDADTLLHYVDHGESKEILDFLSSTPSDTCLECELWPVCGGGCTSFWINNHFSDIENYRTKWGLEDLNLTVESAKTNLRR